MKLRLADKLEMTTNMASETVEIIENPAAVGEFGSDAIATVWCE